MSRAPLVLCALLTVCLLAAATAIVSGKRTPTEPVPGDHSRVGSRGSHSGGNTEPETGGPQEHFGAQVTFILRADKTCPDPPIPPDVPGLIGGEATVTPVSKLTPPDSQGSSWPRNLAFPAQGADRGTCIAELPKGWKYRVTFRDDGIYACDPIEFNVPDTTEVEINVELTMLQFLYVITERDGRGVPARVEVRDPNGVTQHVGKSEYLEGGYRYWCGGLVPEGVWSVRARGMRGPFSEWQDFQVDYSYVPRVVTVQVPAR